ncbi:hypothetical protein AB0442_36870 [Kitasatospora sp. NPDC085895]|uniref:hypothetical protein n=1 Tax=Kitasatospora sp. NPDC085895 TaxID=3155057 RepID=UPI00344D1621
MLPQAPVTRSAFDTGDPEALYEFMRRAYAGAHVRVGRQEDGERMSAVSPACGAFGMDEVHLPMRVRTDPFRRETFVYLR